MFTPTLRRLLAICCFVFMFSGCEAEQPSPSDLFFGLKSYSHIEEIKSVVVKNDGEWHVVENTESPASDKRPPYQYVRVTTNVFEDSNFNGVSTLVFYNDQLMAVWFYPDDWDGYEKHLSLDRGINIDKDSWERVSNNIRNWIGVDYTGKKYIAWEDVGLSKAMKEWLQKHS